MDAQGDNGHFTKRVTLPSGKTIEVVYFADEGFLPEPDAPVQSPAEPHQDLHLCVECDSELVYPVQWEEAGAENWSVVLHCPNCDVFREGVFTQENVELFDPDTANHTAEPATPDSPCPTPRTIAHRATKHRLELNEEILVLIY